MAAKIAHRQQTKGQWGRLKSVISDPLEDMGLPSKGDNRLLDFRAQEQYYERILERHNTLLEANQGTEDIEAGLFSLSLNGAKDVPDNQRGWKEPAATRTPKDSRELSIIIQAMRKIREGIVASHRLDDFTIRVYRFIIRATILLRHMPSYHPALLHLLHNVHPVLSLPAADLNEFVGYYILDLACRQNDLAAAFEVRHRYNFRDRGVELVLKALVHGNWFMFWRVKASMDERQRCLLDSADERVRRNAMNALGKSYLKVQRSYVECATNCHWVDLKGQDNLNWVLEGETVTTRRAQRK